MIDQLVVNGCSYVDYYAQGNGHNDLAKLLNISSALNLSLPGSCNDRIIRTTLRHGYHTNRPTFYLLGMTFLNRTEMPVQQHTTDDGHWVSFQNSAFKSKWEWPWTDADTETFIKLYLKSQFINLYDRAEDLMYKLLSLIAFLHSRGHRVLIFQQAENRYQEFLNCLTGFSTTPIFVEGFAWRAIEWQLNQGAMPVLEDLNNSNIPRDMVHISAGQHKWINNFLVDYIKKYKILQ